MKLYRLMTEKEKLIQEMNELSDMNWLSEEIKKQRKERMVEIAKILLAEHYWYSKKKE